MMTVADTIRGAADVISRHGWHQGDFVAEDGGAVCMLGAVRRYVKPASGFFFSGADPQVRDAEDFLQEFATEFLGDEVEVEKFAWLGVTTYVIKDSPENYIGPVPYLNDLKFTSVTDAMEFLEKAAIAAEEKVT